MRFFKRTVEVVDANYDVATNIAIALDPANRRVRKLEERGTPANGIVTGIRFWYESDTTRRTFAISVKDGDSIKRFGVRTQPTEAHRLRLGVPVVVKVDGDRGILDWEAMRTAWDLGGDFLSQESIRKPPDDGVEDTARDSRVLGRLKKWTSTEATIVSLERRTLMGMATQGWDIQLRLPDGSEPFESPPLEAR